MWVNQRTGTAPDDTEGQLRRFELTSNSDSVLLRFAPYDLYSNRWYGVYVNGELYHRVYVSTGEVVSVWLPSDTAYVHVEDFADWGWDETYNPSFVTEQETGNRVSISWAASPTTTFTDTAPLSSVALTGLVRYSNCAKVDGEPLLGRLAVYVDISENLVVLLAGENIVARGTVSGTDVTFVEVNGSGLAGTAVLEAVADVAVGSVFLDAHWPQSYVITAVKGATTKEYLLNDDNRSTHFVFRTDALTDGTWTVTVKAVSDTGVEDSSTAATGDVTIATRPSPPTDLNYVSGDATATIIQWESSPSSNVTYNVYDSELDDPINLVPIDTGLTPAYNLYTLPAMTPYLAQNDGGVSYKGIRSVLVRAVNATGVVEGNVAVLKIEYDEAGVRVPPPTTPASIETLTRAGLLLTVQVLNRSKTENATKFKLYVRGLEETDDDWVEVDEQNATSVGGFASRGILSHTFDAAGYYWVAAKAVTAAGGLSTSIYKRLVYMSASEPNDVGSFSLSVARGV